MLKSRHGEEPGTKLLHCNNYDRNTFGSSVVQFMYDCDEARKLIIVLVVMVTAALCTLMEESGMHW